MKQTGIVTIHDIAKKLDLSTSTISRALNNNPVISAVTSELVKKTAKSMGYKPNIMAANLRASRSNTIGVIVPHINRYFFSSVISGIEEVAYNNGFTVTISQSNDSLNKEIKIAQTFFSNRVDGIIMSIGMETTKFDHLKMLSEHNVPIIFFDRVVDEIDTHKIVVDDFGLGYMVTEHLIRQGAKIIAHIGGPESLHIYKNRKAGYLKALQDNGLVTNESLIKHTKLTKETGAEAINDIFRNNPNIDAVFCANDTSALGTIVYLNEKGLKVPDDVLVMGFSNEPFSELVSPSISTVRQPGFLMGKKAV